MARTKFRNDILLSSGVKIGSASSYCNIDENGNFSLNGDATTWDDHMLSLTTGQRGATNLPDFDYTNVGYLFPKNDAAEIIYLITQMPHRWKEGSTIYPHLHWVQQGGSAIGWFIDYLIYENGASYANTWDTIPLGASTSAYTSGSFGQINHSACGISMIGKTISTMIAMKLYRNDNTYNGDALARQLDIHYECDGFGSKTEWSK